MLTPVLALYMMLGFVGSMAVYPPSPRLTADQVFTEGDVTAGLRNGEPSSCNPPISVFGSVGCMEKSTNSLIEPMVPLSESKGFNWLQFEPLVRPEPLSDRYMPPSLPK